MPGERVIGWCKLATQGKVQPPPGAFLTQLISELIEHG